MLNEIMLKYISPDTVISIIGVLLSLIGIYASYYFFKKGKTKRILAYSSESMLTLNGEHKDIKICYKDKPVSNLNTSVWEFENKGNQSLIGSDFVGDYNILFSSNDNYTIIGAEIENQKDCSVQIEQLDADFSQFQVKFDYLNPGSVFRINIFGILKEEYSAPSLYAKVMDGKVIYDGILQTVEQSQEILKVARYVRAIAILCFIAAFMPRLYMSIFIIIIGSLSVLFYLIMAFILSGKLEKLNKET
jgi:hypothetical protein